MRILQASHKFCQGCRFVAEFQHLAYLGSWHLWGRCCHFCDQFWCRFTPKASNYLSIFLWFSEQNLRINHRVFEQLEYFLKFVPYYNLFWFQYFRDLNPISVTSRQFLNKFLVNQGLWQIIWPLWSSECLFPFCWSFSQLHWTSQLAMGISY